MYPNTQAVVVADAARSTACVAAIALLAWIELPIAAGNRHGIALTIALADSENTTGIRGVTLLPGFDNAVPANGQRQVNLVKLALAVVIAGFADPAAVMAAVAFLPGFDGPVAANGCWLRGLGGLALAAAAARLAIATGPRW